MKLKTKNSSFQSCRYCFAGGSLYRIDSEEGTYYVCEEHKQGKDFIKDFPIEGIEEEFEAKRGLLTRAINYIKGG